MRYPRDLQGYGPNPPHAGWPGDANVAVQFVLNYEEGGENNILHGDAASEAFLVDVIGAPSAPAALTMRNRPGRSVTSISPFGKKPSAHGCSRSPATDTSLKSCFSDL